MPFCSSPPTRRLTSLGPSWWWMEGSWRYERHVCGMAAVLCYAGRLQLTLCSVLIDEIQKQLRASTTPAARTWHRDDPRDDRCSRRCRDGTTRRLHRLSDRARRLLTRSALGLRAVLERSARG